MDPSMMVDLQLQAKLLGGTDARISHSPGICGRQQSSENECCELQHGCGAHDGCGLEPWATVQ